YTAAADPMTQPYLQALAAKEIGATLADEYRKTLSAEFTMQKRLHTERIVEGILDTFIAIVEAHLDPHTTGVFFPTAAEHFTLRRFRSRSAHIVPDARIKPGCGVLGGMLKNDITTLHLHDIANDSTTLYYYARDVGVRSLAGFPIIAGNWQRGFVVVDSLQKNAFTGEQLSFVSSVTGLLGSAVYYAYLHNEHALEYQRLISVSGIEKKFFAQQSIDQVLDVLVDVVPFAITCDRLTISMLSESGDTAAIKRTFGIHVEGMENRRFALKGKTLASVLYGKNICISRTFSRDRYEVRYGENEQRVNDFVSFLAIPIGVGNCKGMVLIESLQHDRFSEAIRELLLRIVTSASLAIEKLIILEDANTMATHDGLTGLFNHRQFQKMLNEELLRSGRYGDSLALVLCDIDLFKKVNDTWGHQFGDTVLKEVARILETGIRQGIDTAARYGGEEFALILVKTDEAQAIETAERIRTAIGRLPFKAPTGSDVSIAMSFGIALYGTHARTSDDLVKKADKALYRAKEHGRNRVEVF
ncbi:MAG: GGDEF domain-containing protein, partial [Chitinispirillaceae bacterium]|nr:GGDEF domain-containing protein [Chitinispirillaceae bacterium]